MTWRRSRWLVLVAGFVLVATGSLAEGGATIILSVPGIPGPYCAYGVEKRLLELEGIEEVELLWEEEEIRAVVTQGRTVPSGMIRAAFERADYPYDYEITR